MNEVITKETGQQLQVVNPEALIAQAIEKGLPVDTMERLLAMRRELKAEWSRERFFTSLAAFQAECPVIEKETGVDFTGKKSNVRVKYSYATLDQIVAQVKELLKKHGFSYTIKPKQTEGMFTAICYAHHVDGHTEETEFTVPIDREAYMNDAQKVGSANTYARRYAFCNAFGIITGDQDDDGGSLMDVDGDVYKSGKKQAKPADGKRNVTPPSNGNGKVKVSDLPLYDQVKLYVDKAKADQYISPKMAELYLKERDQHRGDDAALQGMLTRITAQVNAAKDALTREAEAGFQKPVRAADVTDPNVFI